MSFPPEITENAPVVLATNLLFGEKRLPVMFITRLEPKNEFDSGWTFFSGFEPEGYDGDHNNFSFAPLSSFLELDPSLIPLVESPPGTTWERHSESSEWVLVTDYEVPD